MASPCCCGSKRALRAQFLLWMRLFPGSVQQRGVTAPNLCTIGCHTPPTRCRRLQVEMGMLCPGAGWLQGAAAESQQPPPALPCPAAPGKGRGSLPSRSGQTDSTRQGQVSSRWDRREQKNSRDEQRWQGRSHTLPTKGLRPLPPAHRARAAAIHTI